MGGRVGWGEVSYFPMRYREIDFFFARGSIFLRGNIFFGVHQWVGGRQGEGGNTWRGRKRGGRRRALKSGNWKTRTSLGYVRSFLEILFNLRPTPSNQRILVRFTITLLLSFLLRTDCLVLLLVPF